MHVFARRPAVHPVRSNLAARVDADRRLEPAGAFAAGLAAGPGPGRHQRRRRRSDLRPGEEHHLPMAARRPAAARNVRPQARRPAGNSRAVQADRDQRAGHPVLRAAAPHRGDCRQAGHRAFDVDRRQHARHQRLLGADRQQVRGRQRPRDQAQRLALFRLGGQNAQAQHPRAGPEHGLDSRHHAAERQRASGRTDRRVPGRSVGSRSFYRRSVGRKLPGRRPRPARRHVAAQARAPRFPVRAGRPPSGRSGAQRPGSQF